MKFTICKPDMDTVLTALLLGWQENADLEVVTGQAPSSALTDPQVFCIECGGSGEVDRGNFDHHNTSLPMPPACVQAYGWLTLRDEQLWSLVSYVATVDQGLGQLNPLRREEGLALSNLFSGMRLLHNNALKQFKAGMEIFRCVINHDLDPWQPMPDLPQWSEYIASKRKQLRLLEDLAPLAEFFQTRTGIKGGYIEASCPGVHGLLRRLGAEISIARGLPAFDRQDCAYVTMASSKFNLTSLLQVLQDQEPGWGGPAHGRIIAAPSHGSSLAKTQLIQLVVEGL